MQSYPWICHVCVCCDGHVVKMCCKVILMMSSAVNIYKCLETLHIACTT